MTPGQLQRLLAATLHAAPLLAEGHAVLSEAIGAGVVAHHCIGEGKEE